MVDTSRCLKMRFSESSCCRCVDICPHGAVCVEGSLSINPKCHGCLLCTAVCPVGALEQNNDFSTILSQLLRVPEPVLGCLRTKEQSNATLACLGGLSEEHVMTLSQTMSGKLTLNLTACHECPNSAMFLLLRQRIKVLSGAGLLEGGCRIITAESVQDLNFSDESVSRRSFFNSFRNSLFQSAATILSSNAEPAARRSEYAVKRLPARRELLNRIRNRISQGLEAEMQKHFDSTVSCGDACSRCQGCVAICPTGALQTVDTDEPPLFEVQFCTGCALCEEFCMEKALKVDLNSSGVKFPFDT